MKTTITVALLLVSAALITPAHAWNWFHNPIQNINRNVGSAPNPTPEDIRQMRTIVVAMREEAERRAAARAEARQAARLSRAAGISAAAR